MPIHCLDATGCDQGQPGSEGAGWVVRVFRTGCCDPAVSVSDSWALRLHSDSVLRGSRSSCREIRRASRGRSSVEPSSSSSSTPTVPSLSSWDPGHCLMSEDCLGDGELEAERVLEQSSQFNDLTGREARQLTPGVLRLHLHLPRGLQGHWRGASYRPSVGASSPHGPHAACWGLGAEARAQGSGLETGGRAGLQPSLCPVQRLAIQPSVQGKRLARS